MNPIKHIPFEIYNVFSEQAWGGNPLAIVPNADDLDSETMQLIARQFNLSETVFICRSTAHQAFLRIFTPEHEMPFAGHPTIGAAAWLHHNLNLNDTFSLETSAKVLHIQHEDGIYRFTLKGYESQNCALNQTELAQALQLSVDDLGGGARWMNAGAWQLIVPLNSPEALARVQPNLHALLDTSVETTHLNLYVWHRDGEQVASRYFFNVNQSIIEDPGTGSACANLGAWADFHGLTPLSWHITQAAAINRPNHLYLNVNATAEIQVGGRVTPFAQGTMSL